MKSLILSVAAMLAGVSAAYSQSPGDDQLDSVLKSIGMDKDEGCLEGPMEQFGRYLGDWDIADEQLQPDGKTWQIGKGARWNFKCLGNGTAIQDFWMPNGGGFGTNLRMYNKETGNWDIAWTNKTTPAMAHISAKLDEAGNMVMHYISPKQSPARRITFFPPSRDSWNWKLEISTDDQKTWIEVYRIKATRRQFSPVLK